MTLREKFAADPKFADGNPAILAALLLTAHEYGDKGFRTDDPIVSKRVATLVAMTDDQFDKEHSRVLDEFSP